MDIYDLDMRPGLPEELERLKAENERLRKALDIQFPGLVEVSKDAERYRWLMADLLRAIAILRKGLRRRNASELIDAAMKGGDASG